MVPLLGSNGIMTKCGAIGGILNLTNTFRGSTIPAKINALQGMFITPDQSVIDGLYSQLSSFQSSQAGLLSYCSQLAASAIIQAASDDAPQTDNSLYGALVSLIAQMQSASQSVQACAVGSSVAASGSNSGVISWAIGSKGMTGRTLENVIPESIAATCTADSQSGGTAVGQEAITLQGTIPAPTR